MWDKSLGAGGSITTVAQQYRVLVVDDDPNISEVVARYLEREGYLVDVASDGDEALKGFGAVAPTW